MANAAHTPGPWAPDLHHTRESFGRTFGFIRVPSSTAFNIVPVAAVTLGVEGMPQDEGRANARLIAAAPDMAASLAKSICYGCQRRFGDNSPEALRDVRGCVNCRDQRAALAKVEGR